SFFSLLFLHSFPTRRSSDLQVLLFNMIGIGVSGVVIAFHLHKLIFEAYVLQKDLPLYLCSLLAILIPVFTYYRKYWMYEILIFRSEEHTSELQSRENLVCRL